MTVAGDYTAKLHKEGPDRLVLESGASLDVPDSTIIVVATYGSDTTGTGSWISPVATLTKALTLVTATRATIYMIRGEYAEAAMITWPNINYLSIKALGEVVLSAPLSTAAVVSINPAATGTFLVNMEGVTIAHSGNTFRSSLIMPVRATQSRSWAARRPMLSAYTCLTATRLRVWSSSPSRTRMT